MAARIAGADSFGKIAIIFNSLMEVLASCRHLPVVSKAAKLETLAAGGGSIVLTSPGRRICEEVKMLIGPRPPVA
jgi:hypothetical protein